MNSQPGFALAKARRAVVAILALAASTSHAASSSAEEYWPQWRGPLANGVAPRAHPPVEWSETKNVKWKIKIPGSGSATPVVWDNRVFLQTAVPTGKKIEPSPEKSGAAPVADDAARGPSGRPRGGMRSEKPNEVYQFVLLCLDRETGKTLWQKIAREEVPHEGVRQGDGSFAAASPMTDGKLVFAYFGSRGLHCYDLDGHLKWEKDFGRMRIKMSFGEGSSCTLSGDKIIVNWDHEGDDFIAALDKETGKELWRQPREEDTSWATPLVVQSAGQAQIVTAATRRVRSYDLASGKLLWECAGLGPNAIPSPVASDGIAYVMSGFQKNALLAIHLGRSGDLTGTDAIAWTRNKSTPYVPSPLLYGDRLYFFAGNNGILSCLDAKSGNPLIDAERLEALQGVYASPVGASGRVYLTGRNGTTIVIKQSDKLEVLATNKLDEKFDASPALSGNELFLRGHEYLYCIAEK
jgi:outer membrane protein assembly factor BamB